MIHVLKLRVITHFLVKYGIHIQPSVKYSTLTSGPAAFATGKKRLGTCALLWCGPYIATPPLESLLIVLHICTIIINKSTSVGYTQQWDHIKY